MILKFDENLQQRALKTEINQMMYEFKRYLKKDKFDDYKNEVKWMLEATTKHILEVESKVDNSAQNCMQVIQILGKETEKKVEKKLENKINQ